MASKYENENAYPGLKATLQGMASAGKTIPDMVILLGKDWTKAKVTVALGALKIVKQDGTLYPDTNKQAQKRYHKVPLTQDEKDACWAKLGPEFIETKMSQTMQAQTKTLNEYAEENARLKIQVNEQAGTIQRLRGLLDQANRGKITD